MRAYGTLGYLRSKALLSALGCAWGLWLGGLPVPAHASADPLADVQLLRQSGCGGRVHAMAPLRHSNQLDQVAAQWAFGHSLTTAAEHAGYVAERLTGLHVTGTDAARLQYLRQTSCSTLLSQDMADVGTYRRGGDAWLVLASTYVPPVSTRSPAFSARVLELVNGIRTQGTSCGGRVFGPSKPVRMSAALEQAAYGHALDMAKNEYFEHQDLTGHTPADRVRAVGYHEKLVGENIAYGPKSAEEVVRGWLDSPGHCENIMDPRFEEMGIAYALGRSPGRSSVGLYWVQVLADPKI